jgi:hypothetical protein
MAPTYSKYSKLASANQDADKGEQHRLYMTLQPIPLKRPAQLILEDGNDASLKLQAVPTDPEKQSHKNV